MTRSEFRKAYAPAAPLPMDYAVVTWREDGRYELASAARVFRTDGAAQRDADKRNAKAPELGRGGYVVRSFARVEAR